jgi:hypothetical protein
MVADNPHHPSERDAYRIHPSERHAYRIFDNASQRYANRYS